MCLQLFHDFTTYSWMYLQQYTEPDCAGDITVVSGIPTGVCLVEYDGDNKVVGSVSFNCDSGKNILVYCFGVLFCVVEFLLCEGV